MAEISEAIAAPIERTLADGKTYKLGRITLADQAEFSEWIKRTTKANGAITYDEVLMQAMTPPGALWLLTRAMQKHDTSLKTKDVGALFGPISEVIQIVRDVVDFPEADEEASAEGNEK